VVPVAVDKVVPVMVTADRMEQTEQAAVAAAVLLVVLLVVTVVTVVTVSLSLDTTQRHFKEIM
jgi:uncharacterized integral membrane protein